MAAGKLPATNTPPRPTIEATITITRSSDPKEKFQVNFEGDWSVVQINAIPALLRTSRRQHINAQKET